MREWRDEGLSIDGRRRLSILSKAEDPRDKRGKVQELCYSPYIQTGTHNEDLRWLFRESAVCLDGPFMASRFPFCQNQ